MSDKIPELNLILTPAEHVDKSVWSLLGIVGFQS